MYRIKITKLNKSYGNYGNLNGGVCVFRDLDLTIEGGEFLTIFGGNGCGKTTLLNIIAGLTEYDSGTLDLTKQGSTKAQIGYIFQHYEASLFPWRSNLDNITFPLEIEGMPKKKRRAVARKFLEELQIDLPLDAYPYQVSGGQKQLVAIARALISHPDILFMDEPFSALDYVNRLFMQEQILRIWRKTGISVLFVSHAPEEAIYLADRCILLSSSLPASIYKEIRVDLPRPRTQTMKKDPMFLESLGELITAFGEMDEDRV